MSVPAFKPRKRVPDGSSRAVIAKLFDDNGGAKQVGFTLGLSVARTYQIAEEGSLSLDDAARLTFACGSTAAAEYFAALCGGFFTPGEPTSKGLRDLLALVAHETGDVFAAMTSPDDTGTLASEIDEAIRALTAARSKIAPAAKAVR